MLTIYGLPTRQRKQLLVSTTIAAKDLIQIYQVDQWRPGVPMERQGCQRPPIRSHYAKLGRNLKDDKRLTLPQSLILSANVNHEKPDKYTISVEMVDMGGVNLVKISIPEGNKLKIVDGQHRALGLDHAIFELDEKELEDFQIPIVIMVAESRLDEIKTFYDINTKGKRVTTDLALQLLNDWNKNTKGQITQGEKLKLVALNIAMELNNDPESVWFNMIEMGNDERRGIIASSGFVKSLSPLLNAISFIRREWIATDDEEAAAKRIAPLVNNYWNALKMLMPKCFPETLEDKEAWYIQRNVGASVWHMVAPTVIEEFLVKRENTKNLTAESIYKFLKKYAGYGVKDADNVWESRNMRQGRAGGEAASATTLKTYQYIANTIEDDIEQQYNSKRTPALAY